MHTKVSYLSYFLFQVLNGRNAVSLSGQAIAVLAPHHFGVCYLITGIDTSWTLIVHPMLSNSCHQGYVVFGSNCTPINTLIRIQREQTAGAQMSSKQTFWLTRTTLVWVYNMTEQSVTASYRLFTDYSIGRIMWALTATQLYILIHTHMHILCKQTAGAQMSYGQLFWTNFFVSVHTSAP